MCVNTIITYFHTKRHSLVKSEMQMAQTQMDVRHSEKFIPVYKKSYNRAGGWVYGGVTHQSVCDPRCARMYYKRQSVSPRINMLNYS